MSTQPPADPSPVGVERHGTILVILVDSPPVNALGAAVRDGLEAAIKGGVADAAVTAMVIACNGRTFFAGADITEFGQPPRGLPLPELVALIEASDKPVVAAIHGTALGGGCEVALACHYRIAVPSARLGLPEVKLGLLPGAGGTQRLPRVIGIAAALDMIVLGAPMPAAAARRSGLLDEVASEGALLADAIALADRMSGVRPIPRVRDRTVAADPAAVAAFRAAHDRRLRGFDAPAACIACIEAAGELPFDRGMEVERTHFMALLNGAQSAAQRHIFFAERQAARGDDVDPATPPREVRRVGVIGAGTMGGGIAMNFLSAGVPVTIIDMQQAALDRGIDAIRRNYDASAARARIPADVPEQAMALLTPAMSLDALADCDLVIEAAYEDMAVKQDIFRRLDAVARPGAILATNTSFLDIDALAACAARPRDVLGLHFFSPAHVMRLLEVVRGAHTAPDVLATALAAARRIGKVAVVAGVCHGFIGNRMLMQRQDQANRLLLEGASPEQIDRVHVDFGMPMGPFQMADLAGIDIGWHRDPTRIDNLRDALAADGRWGQKTRAGFYDYDDRRRPRPSARAAAIIDGFRGDRPRRAIADQEIVERTLYPMVNEGAAILDERVAQRASDIDVVWVHGYGWPVYRGGPMYWAQSLGLATVVAGLERHGVPVAPRLKAAASSGTPL